MTFAPGDIVIADLGAITSGYEQAGVRPAVFVSAEGGVSLLIPLSANAARAQFKGTAHIKPSTKNKLIKPSVALVFQLRAVDSRRLLSRIGTLSTKEKHTVNKVLRSITTI